jgi:8-oxo-dGTP pyrophosphatase MutT (NUDIX family)
VSGPVVAAGGVVIRTDADGIRRFAVVHRPKYDDWSFPKGKLLDGESYEDAARREVEEETGLRCDLERDLGVVRYRDRRGRPKVVRYWTMRPIAGAFAPTDEVDQLRWVDAREAEDLLSHADDRRLLRMAAAPA